MKALYTGLLAAAVGLATGGSAPGQDDPPPLLPPVVTLSRDAEAPPEPPVEGWAFAFADATSLCDFTTDPFPPVPSAFASLQALVGAEVAPGPGAAPAGGACPEPVAASAPLPPFGGSLCCRPKMLGDWGGTRSRSRDRGLNFDAYSTNFFNQVANGGLQETFTYRGRMDYLLNVNGEKAGLWKGFFIDLHGETIYGDSVNRYSGTLMPASVAQLVPVPNGSVTALTGVKFTQALSENFAVFGGKLNILDGFNQPFTGGARGVDGFLNGGLLFNPVLLRAVPYSTFGFGTAVLRNLQPVLSFLVLDANNTPTVSGFDTFFQNGVVLVPQVNIPTKFFGLPGHQGLVGAWSSKKYTTLDRSAFLNVIQGAPLSTLRKDGVWSIGYMFDQALYVSPCDPKRMWGVFGNLGMADTNPSPFRWFANIGVGGSAMRGRPLDTFGIGYYYLGLNRSFKDLIPRVPLRDEHGIEAFYNVAVTPWFRVTPDVQFILPAQERAQHMWYVGLRAKIDF
jgi:porin